MNGIFNSWKIRNNVQVHGLQFAAKQHKAECKRQKRPENFDAFYFALFGKYPTKGFKHTGYIID